MYSLNSFMCCRVQRSLGAIHGSSSLTTSKGHSLRSSVVMDLLKWINLYLILMLLALLPPGLGNPQHVVADIGPPTALGSTQHVVADIAPSGIASTQHVVANIAARVTQTHQDPGQLRLMGMHNGVGIVQMSYRTQWGLICASSWTMLDGDVACRQLGYEGVTRVMRVTPGTEDHLNVQVVLNGTNCEGTESRLIDCEHSGFGNFTESCHPMTLPWVSCIGAEIPEVTDDGGNMDLETSNLVPVMSGRILPPVATEPVIEALPAISVRNVGHDSVSLSWLDWYDRLRASDPRAYRVRILIKYRHVQVPGVESTENYTLAAEVPTYWTDQTIRGLEPLTAYEFIVESVRLSIFGGEVTEPPSAPVYVRTVCGGPPPIRHLHVESPTNNATVLHVHWTMPINSECSSEDYQVEYRQENVDQCETSLLPSQIHRLRDAGVTTKTHHFLTGLQPYSTYTVFVSARNQFGRSRKINATKTTAETVPSDIPTNINHNFQTQNSLKMTWDPPSCGWRGGHILTYAYMLIDIDTDSVVHRGSTRREFIVLSGVDSLQRYKFLVAATTNRGVGPFAMSDIPVEPNILHICGLAQERARISTGMRAQRGAVPWMAQLWSARSGEMFCAGSIINEYWIITAAHCMEAQSHIASNLKIQLGDYDRYMPETHQRAYEVAEIVVHEDFSSHLLDNDIALIRLSERIQFNNYVRPICFPTTKLAKSFLKNGSYGSVAGWGRKGNNMEYPRYLQQVFVPVVERKTCRRATASRTDFTSNMFCAGFKEANRGDACEGDSGAPFSKQHTNGRWYVLGTVSWGDACDDQDKYGYYTRLHRYTSWIKRHTRVKTE